MLQMMRNFVTSWVGMLVLALAVGAMAIVFGQTGTPSGSSSRDVLLASVGDTAITDRQYIAAVNRVVAQEKQQNPDLDTAQFLTSGGGDMVLQQMIISEALKAFADKNGIRASRRLVDGEIASMPAFQLNGSFSEDTFRRLLAEQNISEGELRDSIAEDLLRRQLLQPVTAGVSMPAFMATSYARMLLEQRRGEILPVPSMLMKDPGKPDDKQLDEFYKAHRKDYTIPERRSFRFAEISSSALEERAAPTPEQVRAYYDEHPGEFGGLETRDVQQIMLPDEKAAAAFVAKVKGGTSFLAAAKEAGFGASDVAMGALSEEELSEQLDAASAKAAFALKAPGIAGPVTTSFGQRVIAVRTITPPKAQPFAAVAGKIRADLAEEQVRGLVADLVNQAEDRFDTGESLADVAKALSLKVQSSPPLTRDGRQFSADYEMSEVEQPLLGQVFDLDPQGGPRAVEVDDGHYALVEVTDVVEPKLVPLDKIRADVEAEWAIDNRAKAARAIADRLVKALNDGEAFDKAIAGEQLPPAERLTIRRLELMEMRNRQQMVPPPVLAMLNVPAGKAVAVAAAGGQGWFVVHMAEVQPGEDKDAESLATTLRQTLAQDAGNELAEGLLRTIERTVKVVRRPDALKAVNAQMTGVFDD